MTSLVKVDLTFPHLWEAKVFPARPLILPPRHFVYPLQVEEIELGALEVLIHPHDGDPFLATCALGFREPIVPSGLWSTPNAKQICALAGGYAYIINTTAPEQFTMLPYRPVLGVYPAVDANLLLFVGHRAILAWGPEGEAWQSPKLSDEGVTVSVIEGNTLRGSGWNLITDKETPFELDLRSGVLIPL